MADKTELEDLRARVQRALDALGALIRADYGNRLERGAMRDSYHGFLLAVLEALESGKVPDCSWCGHPAGEHVDGKTGRPCAGLKKRRESGTNWGPPWQPT